MRNAAGNEDETPPHEAVEWVAVPVKLLLQIDDTLEQIRALVNDPVALRRRLDELTTKHLVPALFLVTDWRPLASVYFTLNGSDQWAHWLLVHAPSGATTLLAAAMIQMLP